MPHFFPINMRMFLTMHTNFATVGGNFCRSRTPSVGLYQEGLGEGEKDVQIGLYSISAEIVSDRSSLQN
jgi:hypothetical protein